jgi:hypothetical protein
MEMEKEKKWVSLDLRRLSGESSEKVGVTFGVQPVAEEGHGPAKAALWRSTPKPSGARRAQVMSDSDGVRGWVLEVGMGRS